ELTLSLTDGNPRGAPPRAAALLTPLRQQSESALQHLDLVARGELPGGEDVGAQAAAADKLAEHAGAVAQRRARLAQAVALQLDGADAEALADEVVEADAAGDDVAA